MSTESTIIIQARRALENGSDIDVQIPKYLKGMEFVFNDGSIAKDAGEWFSQCRKHNIKDIKISSGSNPRPFCRKCPGFTSVSV